MVSGQTSGERSVAIWPDIWSEGQVCAFSGLDGATHWASAVAGRTLGEQLGFAFDTQPGLNLVIRATLNGRVVLDRVLPANGQTAGRLLGCRLAAAGLSAELSLGEGHGQLAVSLTFDGSEHLTGRIRATGCPTGQRLVLFVEISGDEVTLVSAGRLVTPGRQLATVFEPAADERALPCLQVGDAIVDPEVFQTASEVYEGRPTSCASLARIAMDTATGDAEAAFALAFDWGDETPEAVLAAAPAGELLCAPPPPDRLAGLSQDVLRCRAKAIAILRANCFAPEGTISRRWIVPQRTKHRNFNTFHAPFLALGAMHFDPELARDVLRATLGQQQANGMIPEQAWPAGQSVDTPPPLLCWAYWQVYRTVGDREMLADHLSRLKDYVKYPLAARLLEKLGHARSSGARFLTWGRGEGSNMDNSPRFDINEPFAAVDLTSYAVAETELIARFIEEITPEHREAVHLGWMAEELAAEVQEYFWHEDEGFFFDRYPDGDWLNTRTLAGLVPLFAGVATAEQAESLVTRHLQDANGFWTEFPLASLAGDDPRYDQNMWRGGAWPGMNLLIIHGLRRYGYDAVADELRQRTIDGLAAMYVRTGSLWEFYDSSGQREPANLPRGRRIGAMPDYGWTAAAFLALLDEPLG